MNVIGYVAYSASEDLYYRYTRGLGERSSRLLCASIRKQVTTAVNDARRSMLWGGQGLDWRAYAVVADNGPPRLVELSEVLSEDDAAHYEAQMSKYAEVAADKRSGKAKKLREAREAREAEERQAAARNLFNRLMED